MELALFTEPQAGGTYAELSELATWAEAAGFDAFARSDHYLNQEESAPTTDALTSLAALARDTSRIRLVVLVTPLTFRHPGVIAKTATTIDEISGGRLDLGVGTGWMESEHRVLGLDLPPLGERFSRLFETLSYLHAAFGRAPAGYEGRHYRLEPVELLPRPTGPLPIIIGGSGPKRTPSYAGRFADEYNLFVNDDDAIRSRWAVARDAAVEAGRDPEALRLSVAGSVIVGDTEAEVADMLGARAAQRGIDVGEYRAMLERRNMPVGTPEQVRAKIDHLASLGVTRFYHQEYKPLAGIDTAYLKRVFAAVRG